MMNSGRPHCRPQYLRRGVSRVELSPLESNRRVSIYVPLWVISGYPEQLDAMSALTPKADIQ